MSPKIKPPSPFAWIVEPLEEDPTFLRRRMFGCEVIYHEGLMKLALIDKEEPWNGIMVCTSREHHPSLQAEFPELVPHEVLGKWLYVSQTDPMFESIGAKLVDRILALDPRIGIEVGKKKKKAARPRKVLLKKPSKKKTAKRSSLKK